MKIIKKFKTILQNALCGRNRHKVIIHSMNHMYEWLKNIDSFDPTEFPQEGKLNTWEDVREDLIKIVCDMYITLKVQRGETISKDNENIVRNIIKECK